MELHCHWPVQTTKMEQRNGGFHAPAHRPVKWVCAFSQITLINQNVYEIGPEEVVTASHDSTTLGVPAGAPASQFSDICTEKFPLCREMHKNMNKAGIIHSRLRC